MSKGQILTKQSYENATAVEAYIQKNAVPFKWAPIVQEFAQTLADKKVLDLGCGPGYMSYLLQELGCQATGLDYSSEMIRRARTFKSVIHPPTFIVGDMLRLTEYFETDTFDAILAAASLLHVPAENIGEVLTGMQAIAKNGARILISLKSGEGTHLVDDTHLGLPIQREFTLWEKDTFLIETKKHGFQLTDLKTQEGRVFMGSPTNWLLFYFTLEK